MKHQLIIKTLAAAILATSAYAAPTVTRLTPPSALFSYGDATPPYISRFLPAQRFDLQATIQADPGQTITSVVFKINGTTAVSPGGTAGQAITALGSDKFSATLRAYSNNVAGVKTLTAEVTQSGGLTTTATGNFEIVNINLNGGRKAKNIIYFIGDGMGIAHRTAARIVAKGVSQGKAIAPLAMDTLPYTAMLMTASLNSIVTDSAPGAACYSTGNKSNNNQEGVFPDDTTSSTFAQNKWDNPRVEHMGNYLARTQGKALGIVSTADVEDATPGSFGVHTQDRGAGTGICDMYLDESVAFHNLRVLMGGGRKWFIPFGSAGSGRVASTTSSGADYTLPADVVAGWGVPAGAVDSTRDLIADFQAAGFTYAADNTAMAAVPGTTTKLLGLFNTGNMDIAMDKIAARRGGAAVGTVSTFPDQPMLDDMTAKALQVLKNNTQGFVLMVEAASIDKQAHNMDTERWVLDTVEFDRAIQKAIDFAATPAGADTLIVVTADHECAGINIIGSSTVTNTTLVTRSTALGTDGAAGGVNGAGPVSTDGQLQLRDGVVGVYEAASFPAYAVQPDGYPLTMDVDNKMLIGYAGNGNRYEDWLTNPTPNANPATGRDLAGDFFIAGQATGNSSAVHTASDIPLSAGGRGSSLFTGTMENVDVFFKAMQALIGGAK
jgi:alkaline phosphatase